MPDSQLLQPERLAPFDLAANMVDDDAAFIALCGVFLLVALVSYSWEIWSRTPPKSVRDIPLNSGSDQKQAVARVSPTESVHSDSDPNPDQTKRSGKKTIWRKWLTWYPGILWLFSIIPAVMFYRKSAAEGKTLLSADSPGWSNATFSPSPLKIDPDIGGRGIIFGIYIPIGLAIFTLLAGLLHNQDSGAKEIGNAQLLTLFYLNCNAVKAAKPQFTKLTFPDVMIACMSIDITAAGLQMTSSGKETLTARWFIILSALNQIVAGILVVAMLARIRYNYLFSVEHCAHVVWWGQIDSCTGPSATTWIYIAVRWCILVHGLWLDWRHSQDFHHIEKDWRSLASGDQEIDKQQSEYDQPERKQAGQSQVEQTQAGNNQAEYRYQYQYGRLRATVFSKWLELLPSVVMGMAGIESLLDRIPINSDITDWGQSAALVLAIAGLVHWAYVFYQVVQELLVPDYRKLESVNFPRYDDAWDPKKECSKEKLLNAARLGNIKGVRRALNYGTNINSKNDDKMTALLYAVGRDDVDHVMELMSPKHLADPTVKGTTPAVSFAAQNGNLKVLKYFIPEPTIEHDVPTLLWRRIIQSFGRNITMVFQTKRRRERLAHQLDSNRRSPLWVAAIHGQEKAAEHICAAWSQDAIMAECLKKDRSTDRTLLFELANAGMHKIIGHIVLRLCSQKIKIDTLQKAADERNTNVLSALLAFGLGTLEIDEKGSSVLHQICRDDSWTTDYSRAIYAHKFEAGQQVDMFDKEYRTPLHYAVLSGGGPIFKLCFAGANPFGSVSGGETPFALAVERRCEPVVQDFLFAPPEHKIDDYGQRPYIDQDELLSQLLDLPDDALSWLCSDAFRLRADENNWPHVIWSGREFLTGSLLYQALDHGNAALFIALLENESTMLGDETDDKMDGRSTIKRDFAARPEWAKEKMKSLLSQMSEEKQNLCRKLIKDNGYAPYLEDPPG